MMQKDIYVKNMPLQEAKEKWHSALQKINFASGAQIKEMEVEQALGQITGSPVLPPTLLRRIMQQPWMALQSILLILPGQ